MCFDGGQWVLPEIQLAAGQHELKFLNTPDFSGMDWGQASTRRGTAEITTGGSLNIRFRLPFAGRYRITFSDVSLEYAIEDLRRIDRLN